MIIEKGICHGKPATRAKDNNKDNQVVDDNVLRVGFAGLAVVLGVATLAFDMAHHSRTDGATPPSVGDGLGVRLSALRAGGVLSWGLHEICS